MFNFAGNVVTGMSLILSFTNRVSIFGISLTAWIVFIYGFEWAVILIRKFVRIIVPGVTFDERQGQELDDIIEYGFQDDSEPAENWMDNIDYDSGYTRAED